MSDMSNLSNLENDAVTALATLADWYDGDTGDDSANAQGCDKDHDYDCESAEYFNARLSDTLAGWTYSRHPKSICLTPPESWTETPTSVNVEWYAKRPIYYCEVHRGYFISNSDDIVAKVEELDAIHNQERIWD